MKDVFYFPHDYNARCDDKIMDMIQGWGIQGYGFYWIIVEMMHEAEDSGLEYTEKSIRRLARRFSADESFINSMLDDFVNEHELFYAEGNHLYSHRVLRNKQIRKEICEKRSKAGKLGGESKAAKYAAQQDAIEDVADDPDVANAKQSVPKKESKQSKERKKRYLKENTDRDKDTADDTSLPPQVFFEKRLSEFFNEVHAFKDRYEEELLQGFYNYWSEPDPGKTCMRKDLERTWDTTTRLAGWIKREHHYGDKQSKHLLEMSDKKLEIERLRTMAKREKEKYMEQMNLQDIRREIRDYRPS